MSRSRVCAATPGLARLPYTERLICADVATGNKYILMEKRLTMVYKDPTGKDKAKMEILERMKGQELVGRRYIPLFDYYADMAATGAFQIVSDTYVTDDR